MEKLKVLKGICLMREMRLGEADDIFDQILSKEESELQIDLYTMRMLGTFANHFHKYEALRLFHEPYYKANPKDPVRMDI